MTRIRTAIANTHPLTLALYVSLTLAAITFGLVVAREVKGVVCGHVGPCACGVVR